MQLRWAWEGTLTTTTGSATTQIFRLTSLYDPDFSGTGSQPRFFDTLCGASGGAAPYGYFRVRRTHYRVMFMNNNSTAGTASYGFVQPFIQNGISNTAPLALYFETPNLVCTSLSPNGNENSVQWVEGTVDHAKFLGVKDFEDDEDLVGSYSSNPGTNTFLTVGVRAQDDSTAGAIRVAVQFVYEAEFFSLNNAGMSLNLQQFLIARERDEKEKSRVIPNPKSTDPTPVKVAGFSGLSVVPTAESVQRRLEKLELLATYFESLRDSESGP